MRRHAAPLLVAPLAPPAVALARLAGAAPRGAVAPHGTVGLRVDHATNLHVASLDVKAL